MSLSCFIIFEKIFSSVIINHSELVCFYGQFKNIKRITNLIGKNFIVSEIPYKSSYCKNFF